MHCLVGSSEPLYEVNTITPILQLRKLKVKEIKGHIQVYSVCNLCTYVIGKNKCDSMLDLFLLL